MIGIVCGTITCTIFGEYTGRLLEVDDAGVPSIVYSSCLTFVPFLVWEDVPTYRCSSGRVVSEDSGGRRLRCWRFRPLSWVALYVASCNLLSVISYVNIGHTHMIRL